jgi:TPR repeat protein
MKFPGVMHENGDGVAQDYVKAREWYQRAADASAFSKVRLSAFQLEMVGAIYQRRNRAALP